MYVIENGKVKPSEKTGHYGSTYVCVIKIDDGRYYVDYHTTKTPQKYGEGRIFHKLYIDGVTTNKGTFIKGSTSRLQLESIYECESKNEAIEVYNLVLSEYLNEKKGAVIYNKKTNTTAESSTSTTPKVSDRTLVNRRSKEILAKNTPCVYFKTSTSISKAIETIEDYLKASKVFEDRLIVTELLDPPQYWPPKETVFAKIGCNELNIYFLIDTKNITSAAIGNELNAYVFPFIGRYGESLHLKITPDSNLSSADPCDILPISSTIDSLKSVLEESEVYLIINKKPILKFSNDIKSKIKLMVEIFSAKMEYLNQCYSETQHSWINSPKFLTIDEVSYHAQKQVKYRSIDYTNQKAITIGSSNQEYKTSIFDCSCPYFQKRDINKISFSPCKHMRALAQELGIIDQIVIPDRPTYLSDPLFEMILANQEKIPHTYGFEIKRIPGWKNPAISLLGTPTEFLLCRYQIIMPEAYFGDVHNSPVYINTTEQKLGTMFFDYETGYYRITHSATLKIYEQLIDGKAFKILIDVEEKGLLIIQVSRTSGFANLYLNTYPDIFEKYKHLEEWKKQDHTPKTINQLEQLEKPKPKNKTPFIKRLFSRITK